VRLVCQSWGFRLADIPVKVHIWHGEEDTSTPMAMAQYMARTIPRAQATFLPGEGHFLLFSRWREILATLFP
jgi:pimeloyl-ACP methyl ester carboxylesterase